MCAQKEKFSNIPHSVADKTKAAVSKKSSPTKAPKVKEEKKQEAKRGDDVRNTRETSTEEIDEFFGDARKSSSRRLQTQSDSEFEGDDSKEVSKDRRLIDSDEDDELELTLEDSTTTSEFNLEEIVKKRLRSVEFTLFSPSSYLSMCVCVCMFV